jgi:hypothetical protein
MPLTWEFPVAIRVRPGTQPGKISVLSGKEFRRVFAFDRSCISAGFFSNGLG